MNTLSEHPSFKSVLKDHFENKSLNSDQIQQLTALQKKSGYSSGSPKTGSGWFNSGKRLHHMAYAVILAVTILFIGNRYLPLLNDGLTQNIIEEITYNHNKRMSMEISSEDLADIQRFLTRLDFPLIQSFRLPESDWQIIGGRYCSIQGKLAAQIKIRNIATGETFTLFQAHIPSGSNISDKLSTDYAFGTKVQLWQEKGLLIALAGGA